MFLTLLRFLKLVIRKQLLPIHNVSPDDSDLFSFKTWRRRYLESFQSKISILSGKHLRNPRDVISHSYPGFPFQCFSVQLFPYYLASLDLRGWFCYSYYRSNSLCEDCSPFPFYLVSEFNYANSGTNPSSHYLWIMSSWVPRS